jgi:hypothetical protein
MRILHVDTVVGPCETTMIVMVAAFHLSWLSELGTFRCLHALHTRCIVHHACPLMTAQLLPVLVTVVSVAVATAVTQLQDSSILMIKMK